MSMIGFIRHGVTDWNQQMRAQGHTDIPLNERGRVQARALSERMRQEKPWDFIYSSDLHRAYETATIIAESAGLSIDSIQTDERLREINCGLIEGTTEAERIEKWGEHWRSQDLGRESAESVKARGRSFITEAVKKHPQQSILIVAHGAWIAYNLQELVPHQNTEQILINTSVTKLLMHDEQWDCKLYNCVKHLQGKIS